MRAVSNDDTSGDKLYNREVADALREALDGRKLDIVGFDACLMGTIEIAYGLRETASVMVASEELEPGDGWDYSDWLAELQTRPDMDARDLGKIMVSSYQKHYEQRDKATTLSAVDLSKVHLLADAITDTARALIASVPSELEAIKSSRRACRTYAPGYGLHPLDWWCFARELARRAPNAAVKKAAEKSVDLQSTVVIANYAGADRRGNYGSYGTTIYFPETRQLFEADPDHNAYVKGAQVIFPVEFVQQHDWPSFLENYFRLVP
jgi:hypothetical protein